MLAAGPFAWMRRSSRAGLGAVGGQGWPPIDGVEPKARRGRGQATRVSLPVSAARGACRKMCRARRQAPRSMPPRGSQQTPARKRRDFFGAPPPSRLGFARRSSPSARLGVGWERISRHTPRRAAAEGPRRAPNPSRLGTVPHETDPAPRPRAGLRSGRGPGSGEGVAVAGAGGLALSAPLFRRGGACVLLRRGAIRNYVDDGWL